MSDWSEYFENSNRTISQQAVINRILIETIAKETPLGGKLLEAGCGTAYLADILADIGFDVTATDIDDDVLREAQSRIQITKNPVSFTQGDLLDLKSKFSIKQFDTIYHSGVMEHFPDDLIVKSMEEQRFISKKVIFKIPNSRTKMSPAHFGDERFMTNGKWIFLLKEAGFQKVNVIGAESMPKWMYFMPALLTLYPKGNSNSTKNKILKYVSMWRIWLSRHSIFVCEN